MNKAIITKVPNTHKCCSDTPMMSFDEYQKEAMTFVDYGESLQILYPIIGLSGEAGEVADKVKKVIRDNEGILSKETSLEIAKEIGDVLWYLAVLSEELGYSLSEIARLNIDKLVSRTARNKIHGSGDNR